MLVPWKTLQRGGAIGMVIFPLWVLAKPALTHGSTPWPEMTPPPQAQVQWVSDDMRINGVPMRVESFQSSASQAEVVAFFEAHWRNSGNEKVAVTVAGADTLVGRPHGPFYQMVKVRSDGRAGSSGTLSVSQILGIQPRIDASGIPAPDRSAQAVNVVESTDAGLRSKQVLWLSKGNASALAGQYHASLLRSGWSLLQQQAAPGHADSAQVRMYAKDGQQLDVSISVDVARRLTVIHTNLAIMD